MREWATWSMLGAAVAAGACEPTFDRPPHLVDESRVLGARAEPAEVAPGDTATITLLAAGPQGTVLSDDIEVALCRQPRGTADSTAVSQDCLEPSAPWIEVVGSGPASAEYIARVPEDACALFGSEPAPAPPDQPPRRPVDPDASGGYYQPARLVLVDSGAVAFVRVRVTCALPSAPAPVAREYARRYQPNVNPAIAELSASAAEVGAGESIRLEVFAAEGSRESYVRYDALSSALEERQETLTVSWFTTAGVLDTDRSDIGDALAASATLTAPDSAGTVTAWAVVRDDRGGADWTEVQVSVRGD